MTAARLFFAACLSLAVVLLAGAAIDSSTSSEIPQEVAAGYTLWQSHGCAGCHTLYGQGGTFGPDLTHIHMQRGDDYLREFLVQPAAFHPDARVMPRFGLTVSEIESLVRFFAWAGDTPQSVVWPPRPVVVSGSGIVGNIAEPESFVDENPLVGNLPASRGQLVFSQRCASCHSLTPDAGGLPGPSLYGIADHATQRVSGLSAEMYLRMSIINPGDYIVEGYTDVMQKNFGDVLSSDDINDLIAFLLIQKGESDDS